MSYPPQITGADIEVLNIIARGYPNRTMTATQRGVSAQVPALTWDEIEIALGKSLRELADSIAHLGANGFIKSGIQLPGLFARMRGAEETHFFWITDEGKAFLTGEPKEDDQIAEIEAILSNLGYDLLLPYGVCVAVLEAWSGYSAAETASRIALTTLALDVKDAYARTGDDIIGLAKFVPHARALIGVLAEFRDNGLMREELAQNDAKAIVGIVTVDQHQDAWIEIVLADPVVGKERLAVSRISYD